MTIKLLSGQTLMVIDSFTQPKYYEFLSFLIHLEASFGLFNRQFETLTS